GFRRRRFATTLLGFSTSFASSNVVRPSCSLAKRASVGAAGSSTSTDRDICPYRSPPSNQRLGTCASIQVGLGRRSFTAGRVSLGPVAIKLHNWLPSVNTGWRFPRLTYHTHAPTRSRQHSLTRTATNSE